MADFPGAPSDPTATACSSIAASHPYLAHLDCSSGVSGDKFLGAVLEAGSMLGLFTVEHLQRIATALAPEAEVTVSKVDSSGVSATSIRVSASNAQPHHRAWRDIQSLIVGCDELSERAKQDALMVFGRLAEAEALVHNAAPEDVEFHEVGAIDSIVDIVGVCAGLDALGVGTLYATPPALGSGTVESAHGTLPVPAPATAALLLKMPTATSTAVGELTTPTGAALLHLVSVFGPVPPMTPFLLGYGAGTRDIGQPNICRLLVGEPAETAVITDEDTAVLLETNIDHITPEAVAFAGEELIAEGALDVWITPIAMKKNRAALTLSVLVSPTDTERFAERTIALTGTLGVRVSVVPRIIAERESVKVDTEWGVLIVKHGAGRYRPEHDDIARISREHGLLYHDVLVRIHKAISDQLSAV